ncbi:MAG: hypothetical protein AB4426_15895 [Xenococcaceae cyanobacterium]
MVVQEPEKLPGAEGAEEASRAGGDGEDEGESTQEKYILPPGASSAQPSP